MSKSKQARQERQRKHLEVRKLLQAFMGELRTILKRVGPAVYRRFPNTPRPCATCAFNPSTDTWPGADATAYALWQAIAKDEPFYCHKNMQRRPGGGYDPATTSELLKLGEDGVIKMYIVGSGSGCRHYLATGDVEELTTVVRARKLQDALLGPEPSHAALAAQGMPS